MAFNSAIDKHPFLTTLIIAAGFFATGTGFMALVLLEGKHSDSVGAILYIASSIWLGKLAIRATKATHPSERLHMIAPIIFSIASGLMVLPAIFGKAEALFWVGDSVNTHVPMSLAVSNWITGSGAFPFSFSINIQGAITHSWTGIIFSVFGQSAISTVLGLAAVKTATCILILYSSREIFGSNRYDWAWILYAIYPNSLFHTTTFYKEAVVHLLFMGSLYFLVRILVRRQIIDTILAGAFLALLIAERFYLPLLFLPMILYIFAISIAKMRPTQAFLIFLILLAVGVWHPLLGTAVSDSIQRLQEMRIAHSRLPGINVATNYDIAYPIAVLKAIFTPYWTPAKLEVFRNFATLFTWGAPAGHLLVLSYLAGVYWAFKQEGQKHLWINSIFFIFVLFIGYISPWAARVKDSVCPMICVYACFYLERFSGDLSTPKESGTL